jgi:hypothetical protein
MLIDQFKHKTNLVDGKDPICYLYRFLIEGFIRVYAKDIYQLRLSNVLLSKTGASGIRTALLTLSDDAHKKKKVCVQVSSSVKSATVLSTSTLISSSSAEGAVIRLRYPRQKSSSNPSSFTDVFDPFLVSSSILQYSFDSFSLLSKFLKLS